VSLPLGRKVVTAAGSTIGDYKPGRFFILGPTSVGPLFFLCACPQRANAEGNGRALTNHIQMPLFELANLI
jgi:hypothetical protein